MKRWLVLGLLFLCRLVTAAEVIPITPIESCFACSSTPSLSMFWASPAPKALILFIPGGEGYFGLKPSQTDVNNDFVNSLKRLTDPSLTSGQYDLVVLDSPSPLSPRQAYPSARESTDHMIRIESAIRFYRDKTGLPVWLLGHSNGGISLSGFISYSQKRHQMDLIAGVIASGIRNESRFEAPLDLPMLFIHNKADACEHTTPHASRSLYEKVKVFDHSPTDYVLVETGAGQPSDPCRSGYHMNYGAGEEYARDVDLFLQQFYPLKAQDGPSAGVAK